MGIVRIYYNTHAAAPLIWCFDYGTQETETEIEHYALHGVEARDGGPDLSVRPKSESKPRVWIELSGVERVEVVDGTAHFYGAKEA